MLFLHSYSRNPEFKLLYRLNILETVTYVRVHKTELECANSIIIVIHVETIWSNFHSKFGFLLKLALRSMKTNPQVYHGPYMARSGTNFIEHL